MVNAQYDLEEIYTEAQKIGIDVGEMVEYGFEAGTGVCSQKYCLNKKAFKDLDEVVSKAEKFGTKLKDSSITAYRKARDCHPFFKEQVTPKVEWIWQLFPLNILAYNPFCFLLTQMCDLGGLLCCWCCWIPW